mmetsp:Transcript_26588/g.67725  ORF Transcript_26588/g.67725 Transcript_26588/m.67725 type:complete len:403 (+) Transcript_26588:1534-2742(+)
MSVCSLLLWPLQSLPASRAPRPQGQSASESKLTSSSSLYASPTAASPPSSPDCTLVSSACMSFCCTRLAVPCLALISSTSLSHCSMRARCSSAAMRSSSSLSLRSFSSASAASRLASSSSAAFFFRSSSSCCSLSLRCSSACFRFCSSMVLKFSHISSPSPSPAAWSSSAAVGCCNAVTFQLSALTCTSALRGPARSLRMVDCSLGAVADSSTSCRPSLTKADAFCTCGSSMVEPLTSCGESGSDSELFISDCSSRWPSSADCCGLDVVGCAPASPLVVGARLCGAIRGPPRLLWRWPSTNCLSFQSVLEGSASMSSSISSSLVGSRLARSCCTISSTPFSWSPCSSPSWTLSLRFSISDICLSVELSAGAGMACTAAFSCVFSWLSLYGTARPVGSFSNKI